jgi:hypothetical protein
MRQAELQPIKKKTRKVEDLLIQINYGYEQLHKAMKCVK